MARSGVSSGVRQVASHVAVEAPDDAFERDLAACCGLPVAGVDEAGRGPWAGPVVAAAVILRPGAIPSGLGDSKALRPERRTELFAQLLACADIGVGIADVERIDRDNILESTMWAMQQAIAGLASRPAAVLVDGNRCPLLPCPAKAVVRGDALSLSIAAASIIAKVTRDRIMDELAVDFPGYGWERNKGYGVPEHRAGLARLGITPHHRKSFAPIRLLVDR